MDTTTYSALKKETAVIERENGIVVFIPSAWVIGGEDRVSYTTIIRLVECCREYHWAKDIKSQNEIFDSICGNISFRFTKSIGLNSTININYSVKEAAGKKYTVEFIVMDENGETCCLAEIVSFFYNPLTRQSIEIPKGIFPL